MFGTKCTIFNYFYFITSESSVVLYKFVCVGCRALILDFSGFSTFLALLWPSDFNFCKLMSSFISLCSLNSTYFFTKLSMDVSIPVCMDL